MIICKSVRDLFFLPLIPVFEMPSDLIPIWGLTDLNCGGFNQTLDTVLTI